MVKNNYASADPQTRRAMLRSRVGITVGLVAATLCAMYSLRDGFREDSTYVSNELENYVKKTEEYSVSGIEQNGD